MNTEQLQNWLQIVGLGGVIVSLKFVGFEIQQSRQIAIADVYQQRAALVVEVQNGQMANDRLFGVHDKLEEGQALGASEERLLNVSIQPWLSYYENNHFQYEIGLLSEEHWVSSREALRSLAGTPFFQERWTRDRKTWRESFAQEIDELIAEEIAKRQASD